MSANKLAVLSEFCVWHIDWNLINLNRLRENRRGTHSHTQTNTHKYKLQITRVGNLNQAH